MDMRLPGLFVVPGRQHPGSRFPDVPGTRGFGLGDQAPRRDQHCPAAVAWPVLSAALVHECTHTCGCTRVAFSTGHSVCCRDRANVAPSGQYPAGVAPAHPSPALPLGSRGIADPHRRVLPKGPSPPPGREMLGCWGCAEGTRPASPHAQAAVARRPAIPLLRKASPHEVCNHEIISVYLQNHIKLLEIAE